MQLKEVKGRRDTHTGFWGGNLKETNRLEDKDTDGKIILKWIFKKQDGMTYAGIIWLRIGTGGELL